MHVMLVPNTATASAPGQLRSRWLLSQAQSVVVVCFGSKKRHLLHKFKGSFARNLPVGLQFTRGTRILLRPDVLCAMTSHPVVHVILTLPWNRLGIASFEVHKSQRDVRLGKVVFHMFTLKGVQIIHRATPYGCR
jgi:hypothetical protein